jgi:hypothetical protein
MLLFKNPSHWRKLASLLLLGTLGCAASGSTPQEGTVTASAPIREVLKKNTDRLLAVPGVVGTAIGESGGKPCILVLVSRLTAELRKQIPAEIEGYPVVIRETGTLRPLDQSS